MKRPEWTGKLVGQLHNNRVTYDQLAARLGVTKSYVSMVLSGYRTPRGAQERFEKAFNEVLIEKEGE